MNGSFRPGGKIQLPDWLPQTQHYGASQLVLRHWPPKAVNLWPWVLHTMQLFGHGSCIFWIPRDSGGWDSHFHIPENIAIWQACWPWKHLPDFNVAGQYHWRTMQTPKLPTTLGIPAVAEVCVSRPLFYIHDIKVKKYSQREPMVALSMVFKQIWACLTGISFFGVYLDLRLLENKIGKMGLGGYDSNHQKVIDPEFSSSQKSHPKQDKHP